MRATQKAIFTIALIVFLVTTLVGCTVKKAEQPSSQPAQEARVTLKLVHSFGNEFTTAVNATLVVPFMKSHTNTTVIVTNVGETGDWNLTDNTIASLKSGDYDLAMFDRFLVSSYAAKGIVEDITPYVATADFKTTDYYRGPLEECRYKGKMYCLPWDADNLMLLYNKTMMKSAGLDPNKPPATLQELDEMARAMTKKGDNGDYAQMGFIPWDTNGLLFTQGLNFGAKWDVGGELMPNDPQVVKALEWMVGYAKEYDIRKIETFEKQEGAWFFGGRLGFTFGTSGYPDNPPPSFEWGVAPIPAPKGNEPITWTGGFSLSVLKGTKHPKEAAELLKYIAGKEGKLLWGQREGAGREMTALPEVNEKLGLHDDPRVKPFLDTMDQSLFRPVSPAGALMWNETIDAMNKAIHGEGEPKMLLDAVKQKVDAELAKYK